MFGKIKKGFCIVLVLVTFVFIMTSCGEKSEPDTSSSVDVGTTAAEPDTSSSNDVEKLQKIGCKLRFHPGAMGLG